MLTRGAVHRRMDARADRGQLPVAGNVVWLVALLVVARIALAEGVHRDAALATGTEYRILLELTRKDTFVTIPAAANASATQVTLERVDYLPSRYRLVPASGIVCAGQSVDIVLDKTPDVRIRLSLVTRGNELAVKVSPLIGLERRVPVDFTLERVQRTVWSLQRRVKELQRRAAASRKEFQRIDTWLATPGNKPLDLVKAAHLQQKLLQRDILACQSDLPFMQKRYAALCKIAELAQQIHGATVIRFTVDQLSYREH